MQNQQKSPRVNAFRSSIFKETFTRLSRTDFAEMPLDYAFENRDIIPHQRAHVLNLDAYSKGISA